jgi:hypothetical protein
MTFETMTVQELNQLRGSNSQRTGASGEDAAALALGTIHTLCEITRIHTGWKVLRFRRRARGGGNHSQLADIIPLSKVAGDFRAVVQGSGRSVLVEVKTRENTNLTWTAFEPHQRKRLQAHTDAGAVGLVVWVHASGVYVLRWPIPGFRKGKGVTPRLAAGLDLKYKDIS